VLPRADTEKPTVLNVLILYTRRHFLASVATSLLAISQGLVAPANIAYSIGPCLERTSTCLF
jgi:hypothetical protein